MKKEGILFALIILLMVNLIFAGELRVTQEHPFLVEGKWIPASALNVGDELITSSGQKVKIISIKDVSSPTEVYNLDSSETDDFVIGKENIVVHNSDYFDSARTGRLNEAICGGIPEQGLAWMTPTESRLGQRLGFEGYKAFDSISQENIKDFYKEGNVMRGERDSKKNPHAGDIKIKGVHVFDPKTNKWVSRYIAEDYTKGSNNHMYYATALIQEVSGKEIPGEVIGALFTEKSRLQNSELDSVLQYWRQRIAGSEIFIEPKKDSSNHVIGIGDQVRDIEFGSGPSDNLIMSGGLTQREFEGLADSVLGDINPDLQSIRFRTNCERLRGYYRGIKSETDRGNDLINPAKTTPTMIEKTASKESAIPLENRNSFVDNENDVEDILGFNPEDPFASQEIPTEGWQSVIKIKSGDQSWSYKVASKEAVKSELANREEIKSLEDTLNDWVLDTNDAIGYETIGHPRVNRWNYDYVLLNEEISGRKFDSSVVNEETLELNRNLVDQLYDNYPKDAADKLRVDMYTMQHLNGEGDMNPTNFIMGSDGKLKIFDMDTTGELYEFNPLFFQETLDTGSLHGWGPSPEQNTPALKEALINRGKQLQANKEDLVDKYMDSLMKAGFSDDEMIPRVKNFEKNIDYFIDNVNDEWNNLKKLGLITNLLLTMLIKNSII